jgi:mono/diheme cytochrome c family protein
MKQQIKHGQMKMKLVIKSIMVVCGFFILSACSNTLKPNVEVIQDMMESPAVKAQEYDESSPDGIGMRVPAKNSIPVGFKPYAFKGDVAGSDKNINPMAGDFSETVLVKGQKLYFTNCAICHGDTGKGDGSVASLMMLKPPTLHSDKVKDWTDGHIYHVITEGQGLMGPYATHIPQKYRWQVVNYVRFLQKNNK